MLDANVGSMPINTPIHTTKHNHADHSNTSNNVVSVDHSHHMGASQLAEFVEERYGFAPDHAALIAEHVIEWGEDGQSPIQALASQIGVDSVTTPVTAEEIESATFLLEQLLDSSVHFHNGAPVNLSEDIRREQADAVTEALVVLIEDFESTHGRQVSEADWLGTGASGVDLSQTLFETISHPDYRLGDALSGEIVESLTHSMFNGARSSIDVDGAIAAAHAVLREPDRAATLDIHRQTLAEVPPGTELQDYTPEQIEAYNELHKAFMQEHGDHVLQHHHQWHGQNGSGGRQGPGSGAAFVTMHRNMMANFEEFVNQGVPNGDWRVPELDPSRPLPPNLGQPSDVRPDLADRTSNDPNTTRPDFLTLGGNSEPPFVLDGKAHRRLEDFETLDDLGRALGERYHGSVHVRLGGTMASFDSPMDPTFYAWHGEIDGVVQEWLQTENGQDWAAANPDLAAPWGVAPPLPEPPIGGPDVPIGIPGGMIPDELRDIFSNLSVGFEMDADDSGVLEAPEISDFLQSEYGMSSSEAARVAEFLVRASGDGRIESGQELAQLMGVQTLEYTDTEKLQDAIGNALGGNPFDSGSSDSRAMALLKLRAALSAAINMPSFTEIPSIRSPLPSPRDMI